jgi:hypothetical protein
MEQSKLMGNKPNHKPPQAKVSPADHVAACERVIAVLAQKRVDVAERAASYVEARDRLAYAAHVEHDPESRTALIDARDAAVAAERELGEIDSALATARGKLDAARQVVARAERKAVVLAEREQVQRYRELGPFLDKATGNLRDGLQALAKHSASVGRDHRHVATMSRCLAIALFDTPFRDAFGVPDSNDKRVFASFSGVINQWCDSFDANLAHELAMLDAEQTTEAA